MYGKIFRITVTLLLLGGVSLGQLIGDPNLIVNDDELGAIQGAYMWTIEGEQIRYITFNGIPYAKPESYMDANRFKPSTIWEGKLESTLNETYPYLAINPFIFCPQPGLLNSAIDTNQTVPSRDMRNILKMPALKKMGVVPPQSRLEGRTIGQEDCLVLNVNTPAVPVEGEETELLPVVVFLHGGGSELFWGSLWNGMRFLKHRVVLVTINYRLGILGSLNLNIDDAPGNAALYDLKTSLEWIQKHIANFGGDPNRVTISGQSAGGMMVSHLMMSPLVKDQNLFHGVMGFSGSALNVWAVARKEFIPLHLKVATYSGCYSSGNPTTMQEVRDCMAEVTPSDLVIATYIMSEEQEYEGKGLEYEVRVPTIQHPSLTIPRMIEKHPLEILANMEQTSVPLMMGGMRHDGSFALANLYDRFIKRNGLDEDGTFLKNELIPTLLRAMGVDVDPVFYHALTDFFLGESKLTDTFEDKIPGLIDMTTTYGMKNGALQLVEEHSKLQPLCYSYSFDYKGQWPLQDILGDTSVIPGGVGHNDDLLYLFQLLPLLRKADSDVSDRWMDKIIKFIYYGNPNGENVDEGAEEWPRYNSDTKPSFVVDKEDYVDYNPRDHWNNVAKELWDPTWKYK